MDYEPNNGLFFVPLHLFSGMRSFSEGSSFLFFYLMAVL